MVCLSARGPRAARSSNRAWVMAACTPCGRDGASASAAKKGWADEKHGTASHTAWHPARHGITHWHGTVSRTARVSARHSIPPSMAHRTTLVSRPARYAALHGRYLSSQFHDVHHQKVRLQTLRCPLALRRVAFIVGCICCWLHLLLAAFVAVGCICCWLHLLPVASFVAACCRLGRVQLRRLHHAVRPRVRDRVPRVRRDGKPVGGADTRR
jgi:hypothetical protein